MKIYMSMRKIRKAIAVGGLCAVLSGCGTTFDRAKTGFSRVISTTPEESFVENIAIPEGELSDTIIREKLRCSTGILHPTKSGFVYLPCHPANNDNDTGIRARVNNRGYVISLKQHLEEGEEQCPTYKTFTITTGEGPVKVIMLYCP